MKFNSYKFGILLGVLVGAPNIIQYIFAASSSKPVTPPLSIVGTVIFDIIASAVLGGTVVTIAALLLNFILWLMGGLSFEFEVVQPTPTEARPQVEKVQPPLQPPLASMYPFAEDTEGRWRPRKDPRLK